MNWNERAKALVKKLSGERAQEYLDANSAIIRKTVAGIGLDSGKKSAGSGIRIVFNISSAYLGQVLVNGYKNCYDLKATSPVGSTTKTKISMRRQTIDEAISKLSSTPTDPHKLYYGALELNGTGMRYYGDMCLVLKEGQFEDATLVLYRNSYDLDREPIRSRVSDDPVKLAQEAQKLAGTGASAPDMIICKILDGTPPADRLLTTGTISDGILYDEDYLEVPRAGSFGANDIAEIRTSAADVAAEGRIANRLQHGPSPSLAELIWRNRRREAESAAAQATINVRVITSRGRVRA